MDVVVIVKNGISSEATLSDQTQILLCPKWICSFRRGIKQILCWTITIRGTSLCSFPRLSIIHSLMAICLKARREGRI